MNMIRRFYMDTRLVGSLAPGSRIAYTSRNGKHIFLVGVVREVVPLKRFVHTFRFTRMDEAETLVTYELEPEGKGTRLTVFHTGFTAAPKTRKMVRGGWPFILRNLKSMIERGVLPFSSRLKYMLMKAMLPLLPGKKRWEDLPAPSASPE